MKSIRVSAAIIHDNGKIYATRRGKGVFKGMWEFPGGKREKGESGEEAAIREIREELDATIAIEGFFTTIEYQYPDFLLVMDCYLATVAEGRLTLREHDDAIWLSAKDIGSLEWLPADRLVAAKIKEHFDK